MGGGRPGLSLALFFLWGRPELSLPVPWLWGRPGLSTVSLEQAGAVPQGTAGPQQQQQQRGRGGAG